MASHELPVIVLAAGRGVRLGELTEDIPKCMLPLLGTTVVRRQIDLLIDVGLSDIHVVTGYKDEKLREHLSDYEINFIHNPSWHETNNIYSLHLARDIAMDGFYLLNSDVLFHAGILSKFVSTSGTAMVVDDYKVLGEEEMKVIIRQGRVVDIGKDINPEEADGEYIGILRFDASDARRLFDEIEVFIERGDTGVWYENAIREILGEVLIKDVSTEGLPWIEIDTPEDYEKAKRLL